MESSFKPEGVLLLQGRMECCGGEGISVNRRGWYGKGERSAVKAITAGKTSLSKDPGKEAEWGGGAQIFAQRVT